MKNFITATILIAIAGSAFAHGKATGIVRERMDSMVLLGKTMKSLSLMAKSDAQLDKAALETASQTIEDHSGENLTKLFPVGSTKHSDATPLVWSQSDEFAELALKLSELGKSLPNISTRDALQKTVKELGASCKACHSDYRQKTD
jgi:cytochrome c556